MKLVQVMGLAIGLTGVSAQAATITEYFNNYGTSDLAANGLGAAVGGWAGAWISGTNYANYKANTALSYSGSGYTASLNQTDTNDGTLAAGSAAGVGNVSFRSLSPAMTGTVWVSSLVSVAANGKDILMAMDTSSINTNFVALRGSTGTDSGNTLKVPEPVIKYNNGTDSGNNLTFAAGTTHLFLLKIVMNYSGTSDSVDFWVDPTLGASAPTSAAIYSKNVADVFGVDFGGVGFSFASGGGSVDAIRISNDTDGYVQVTGIPEPALGLLTWLGLTLPLARRARR